MNVVVNYSNPTKVPADYRCSSCSKTNVKLWRASSLSRSPYLCVDCVANKTGTDISTMRPDGHYTMEGSSQLWNSIGGHVPAIPTPDNIACWAAGAYPREAFTWWVRLLLR